MKHLHVVAGRPVAEDDEPAGDFLAAFAKLLGAALLALAIVFSAALILFNLQVVLP